MMAGRGHLVVLAAGGSGGHVFPAEALAAELVERGCRMALVTDRRGGHFGGNLKDIETHRIRAGGVAGKSFGARLRSAPELALGTWQARSLLRRINPQAVVGFGGYASVPTMLAAAYGGFSTAIHEQNAVLGRANRLLASRVGRIATSFENSRGLPAEEDGKVIHTGMPVRPAIAAERERPYPPLDGDAPIGLLVLGGSQGARVFSHTVPDAVGLMEEHLRRRLRISQQCRPEDLERVRQAYGRLGIEADLDVFFDDVPERMAAAHLLVSRAGASTVAEGTAIGRPAILVPYPHAIDDHQSYNAHSVDEAGAGWVMPENGFTPQALSARLNSLFDLPAILEKAASCALAVGRADAAGRLADVVQELLPSNGEPEQGRKAA
jgi:UDP-N-acetylglucosamine--N-acetylmuramyl-(pentapeptide) pyrophosphoryl-undecaprenol N-acetylglucosamine transferase